MVPKAKTTMPHVPARHVGRPRLLALLDAAEPGGLLLVSAPAGYGKTLLLAEWAARRPDRVAWLSLDDDDRAAPRFWAAVLAALRGCAAVGPALDRLDPAQDGFLVRLLEALDRVPGPVDLVLDDVHALPPGSAAVRALAALVRERPRALRLVLAGRADPPLPIARLRLSGELREIRARDLAFSPDEAAALLAGARPGPGARAGAHAGGPDRRLGGGPAARGAVAARGGRRRPLPRRPRGQQQGHLRLPGRGGPVGPAVRHAPRCCGPSASATSSPPVSPSR